MKTSKKLGSSFVIHSLVLPISISKSIPACSKSSRLLGEADASTILIQSSCRGAACGNPKEPPLAITITKSGS